LTHRRILSKNNTQTVNHKALQLISTQW